jgi:hypothetical protein
VAGGRFYRACRSRSLLPRSFGGFAETMLGAPSDIAKQRRGVLNVLSASYKRFSRAPYRPVCDHWYDKRQARCGQPAADANQNRAENTGSRSIFHASSRLLNI